jgi:hypothetical protein
MSRKKDRERITDGLGVAMEGKKVTDILGRTCDVHEKGAGFQNEC